MLPEILILPSVVFEGTGTIVFEVRLSEASLSDITVQYRAVQDGTALVGRGDVSGTSAEDTFTLTIPAGSTQAEIAYSINGNDLDEFDENFTLELSDPVNAILSGGEPVLTATGVILDSDGGQNLALFVSDPLVFETDTGGQQAVFEIRLSQPFDQSITLNYSTADGTALAGEDYVATSGSVTFAPGQTVASVAVDIIGDTINEILETFSLVVTPTAPIANGVDDATGVAEILNDDGSDVLPEISVSAGEMREITDTIVFRVNLSEASLSDITVQYRAVQDGTALVGRG
uniref:Calx-beta domain-containing protein n=3 Tax=uncultured Tateyamaria sp. TaxID=455651 RepID=UPI0026293AA0